MILVCFTRQALATVNRAARVTLTMYCLTAINQLLKVGVMKRESVACQRKGRILCNRCFCRNAMKSKGFGVAY